MNHAVGYLIGRLEPDPRYARSEAGTAHANFYLRVQEHGGSEGTYACAAHGSVAEFMAKEVEEGDRLLMVGNWETSHWTHGPTGEARQRRVFQCHDIGVSVMTDAEGVS